MSYRVLLASLAFLSASVSLPARQALARPAQAQPITSGVTAVVVDVVVRDNKGNPVTDLRREDFRLFEDGVQQEISDSVVVMPGSRASALPAVTSSSTASAATAFAGETAKPPGENFLAIVFDRLSEDARPLAYKGALAYLETFHENDFVGVFVSDLGSKTVQNYTNDREKIRKAIYDASMTATSNFNRSATRDDLKNRDERGGKQPGDAHPDVPVVASAESEGRPVDGREGLLLREIQAVQQTAWETLMREEQGYATTNALLAIATGLGTLPGRKSVVFFAEGIAIPPAVAPHFQNVITTANRANVSFYTIDAAGLRVHSTDAATGRAVRAMGAAGIEVSSTGESMSSLRMLEYNEETLRRDPRTSLTMLAKQTGGFLVENTNDLGKAFRQVDSDRRFHYLLTYIPKNANFGGEWRAIEVKVPNRKVTIRARAGYQAVRAPATTPLFAYEGPALAALDRTTGPSDLPVRAQALVFPGSDGRDQVAVLASTSAGALTFRRDEKAQTYRTDFTILARILDSRGLAVRKSSQPYRLTGPLKQMDQAQRGNVLFFRQPSMEPGRYTLEVAVHDALAGKTGVQRTTFTVPAGGADALRLGDLIIVHHAERVPPAERQANNPLYFDDVVIYPNMGQPLAKSRDKAVTFYVVVAPGVLVTPRATLEMLRGEEVVSRSPVALPKPDTGGRIAHVAQVPLDALPPGRYTLRLTVTQGNQKEVRETPFVIQEER
jgi:VWFA-related protein